MEQNWLQSCAPQTGKQDNKISKILAHWRPPQDWQALQNLQTARFVSQHTVVVVVVVVVVVDVEIEVEVEVKVKQK